MVGEQFERFKELAWQRILRDREIGYLDPDIFDVLEAINRRRKSFTMSSCSGRVTIVDAEFPWDRKGSTVVFKNHLIVTEDDLRDNVSRPPKKKYWLIVQGPIFHVYTKDLEEAMTLLSIARGVGFKHSGIMVANEKGYLVELRTGVRMDHLLTPEQDLARLAEEAMRVLLKGKERKERLKEAVLRSLESDNPVQLRENPVGQALGDDGLH